MRPRHQTVLLPMMHLGLPPRCPLGAGVAGAGVAGAGGHWVLVPTGRWRCGWCWCPLGAGGVAVRGCHGCEGVGVRQVVMVGWLNGIEIVVVVWHQAGGMEREQQQYCQWRVEGKGCVVSWWWVRWLRAQLRCVFSLVDTAVCFEQRRAETAVCFEKRRADTAECFEQRLAESGWR